MRKLFTLFLFIFLESILFNSFKYEFAILSEKLTKLLVLDIPVLISGTNWDNSVFENFILADEF